MGLGLIQEGSAPGAGGGSSLPDPVTVAHGGTGAADAPTALTNLGAVATTDGRLSNSRTPTGHGSTHAPAGSDPVPPEVGGLWLPSTFYDRSGHHSGGLTTLLWTAGNAWYVLHRVRAPRSYTTVAVRVTVAAAGNVEIAMYPLDASTFRPSTAANSRLWTSGNISVNATGFLTAAITWNAVPGWYAARFVCDVAPTFGAQAAAGCQWQPWGVSSVGLNPVMGFAKAVGGLVTSPTAADDIATGWTNQVGSAPLILLA